jgi:hypothetical protein
MSVQRNGEAEYQTAVIGGAYLVTGSGVPELEPGPPPQDPTELLPGLRSAPATARPDAERILPSALALILVRQQGGTVTPDTYMVRKADLALLCRQ